MSQSLQEKIAARYQRIHEKRTFVLPVPGYSDFLSARYRPLPIEDTLRIFARRQQAMPTTVVEVEPDTLVANAADVLINACEELLEKNGDGTYHTLGKKWNTATIGELFPVVIDEDNPSVRWALVDALTSDGVIDHFNAYEEEVTKIKQELERATEGESPAATAATSSNSQPEPPSPVSP